MTETDSPGESNWRLLTDIVVNEVLTHTDAPLEDAIEFDQSEAFKKIYTEWDKYRKTQNAWFSVAEMRMDRSLQTHK